MGSWTIGYAYDGKLDRAKVEEAVRNELSHYNGLTILKMHTSKLSRYDSWDYVTHAVCRCDDGQRMWTIVYTVCSGLCNDCPDIMGKIMDESVGPSYAEFCPASYLKMVSSPVNDYAKEWRDRVAKAHAEKNVKVEDRRYRIGTEELTMVQTAERMGIPACLFVDNRVVKKQKIGCAIVYDGVEAYRIC